MKRSCLLAIAIPVFIMFSLGGCTGSNTNTSTKVMPAPANTVNNKIPKDDDRIVLLFSHGAQEKSPTQAAALKFKNLLEEYSKGRLLVDIYPDHTLGNYMEMEKALKSGTIQVGSGTISSKLSPKFSILNLPDIFPDDQTAAAKLSKGPLREAINAEYEKQGLVLLGVVPDSYRVTSSKKPIRNIEDFKGLKIRVLDDDFLMEYWKALGAQPMYLPINQVYTALQQNLVEAQENPLATIIVSGLYEHQKYIILTNHFMHYNAIFMSKVFYDSLPAEYKTLINENMQKVMEYSFDYSKRAEKEARRRIADSGLEIIELSSETHSAIRRKLAPVFDAMAREHTDNTIYKILTAAKQN